jgi:hypothetical protein
MLIKVTRIRKMRTLQVREKTKKTAVRIETKMMRIGAPILMIINHQGTQRILK